MSHCLIFLINSFLREKGFIELFPTILSPITDPLNHDTYISEINVYNSKFYLTQSMILHKQLALKSFDAVKVVDDSDKNIYPLAIDTEKIDKILVGRLRADIDNPFAFNMWITGNNIRKGAALNAMQIASYMIKNKLI